MKHRFLTILLLIFSLISCSPSEEKQTSKIPARIIQIDAMAAIIADIQIAEAVLREHSKIGQQTDDQTVNYLTEIFEKHKVTKEQFAESKSFYEKNIYLYDQVFEKVITLLTQRQTELKNPPMME